MPLNSAQAVVDEWVQLYRRCSIVSTSPHSRQAGLSRVPDLKALLFVQIVLLRVWKATSFVLDGMMGRLSTL